MTVVMHNIVGIQARMSSTRLPGKVLADLCGKPMIARVHDACDGPWLRVLLTSRSETDDVLVRFAEGYGMECERGLLNDVIWRYHQLAMNRRPELLVRVCGDAPFMRAEWIHAAIAACKAADGAPVFVPELLHVGTCVAWDRAFRESPPEEMQHAGSGWFEQNGTRLDLAPPDYMMVNTEEDLQEARRRIGACA